MSTLGIPHRIEHLYDVYYEGLKMTRQWSKHVASLL